MQAARSRTALLVNLAMCVEQANEQVLPAVYLFVGRSLNATPVQLGTLTLCRAMVQTLSSPLSGVLGDRYDRVLVLSTGAFIWGVMTSAMALTVTLRQAMMFAALNGVGLALLVPCCQSLIADLYPAEQRGRAFGTLQLTASLGGMCGGVFATNLGGHLVAGIEGWRVAFHTIAAISILVGGLALLLAVDPRRFRYTLLTNTADVARSLLHGSSSDHPSPASSAAPSPHEQHIGGDSSTGTFPNVLTDRRRPGQAANTEHAGLLTNSSSSSRSMSSGKAMWQHSSSWHEDLQQQHTAAAAAAPAEEEDGTDDVQAHAADDTHKGSSSSRPPAVVSHRPSRHLTLTVDSKGIHHPADPGEQLLQSPSAVQHKQHRAMLHTQQSVQQRNPSPGATRTPLLHTLRGDTADTAAGLAVHRQQQQHHHKQQQHLADGGGPGSSGSSTSGSSSPRKPSGGSSSSGKFKRRGVVGDVLWMLRIRTFQAIVLQGIVGCFPWQAMVFFTLWLQLNGFSNATSSMLVATFGAGVALGGFLGGSVGDRMARRLPNNGRIFTAQFSVLCGIPLTWVILKGLPASTYASTPLAYGLLMLLMGLTCTWAGAGCNSPIFAEIVPDELRSTIYAFDRSFENSVAACAAPVVGLLAERVFGFTGVLNDKALEDETLRAHNAAALGSSLLACMTVPWSLCLLAYSALHWFYPRDRALAKTWASAGGSGSSGAAAYHH